MLTAEGNYIYPKPKHTARGRSPRATFQPRDKRISLLPKTADHVLSHHKLDLPLELNLRHNVKTQ